MKVAIAGGLPDVLGGGGLEVQSRETALALRRLGIDARLRAPYPSWRPDVIHLLGADPATWNWARNLTTPCPLVLSPVLVLPRVNRLMDRYLRRFKPGATSTIRMRWEVVKRATHVIALTPQEAMLLQRAYGVHPDLITVIGNGSAARAPKPAAVKNQIVSVGTINDRKDQLGLVHAWQPTWPKLVLAGSISHGWSRARDFYETVAYKDNVVFVGPLPQAEVWQVQSESMCTISHSRSEGESLALLDSLAVGRPALLRTGWAADALAARYPSSVRTYKALSDPRLMIRGLDSLRTPPSWEAVAAKLIPVYSDALTRLPGGS